MAQESSSNDSISQSVDTTIVKKKINVDSLKIKSEDVEKKIATGSDKAIHVIDSADSQIRSMPQKGFDRIDSINSKFQNGTSGYTDSIQSLLTKAQAKLQVDRLNAHIDSLKRIGQPYEKYSSKLDSLTNLQTLTSKTIGKPVSKVTEAQDKVNGLQSKSQKSIQEKMGILSKGTGGKGNIPSGIPTSNLTPDLKVPSLNTVSNPDLNLKSSLPSIDQPSLSTPQLGLKDPNLTNKFDIKNTVSDQIDTKKLGDVTKGAGEISKVSSKVNGYSDDVKNIKEGKLDQAENIQKEAMTKLPVRDQMQVIQKQEEMMKSQQEQMKSFRNPEEYKRQTLARARKMVTLQLATQDAKIQESVAKLSRYQQKATSVLNKKNDLPKKRDALRKVKKHERFVPGLTLQIQKPNGWLIDTNPSLRYRLTVYWSIGTGWSERINFGDHLKSYSKGRVFGPRAFSEVVLYKGFSFRFDVEDRNLFVAPSPNLSIDTGRRLWIWNYMAGIKKEFSFVPGVIGNAQFMYNLYSSSDAKIYPSQFNVRVGFEFPFRKKVKQS